MKEVKSNCINNNIKCELTKLSQIQSLLDWKKKVSLMYVALRIYTLDLKTNNLRVK